MCSPRAWSALLLPCVAAACGVGEAQWAGSVTDSAGVSIVANTDVGMWGEGEGWMLEEEIRIGALEGNPDYQFGQIGWLAVGSDGSIYVLDAQAQNVKHYSATGEYMRTFGGPGGGPGELGQGAVFLVMGAGDTLVVPDVGNQRVNRYTADGESLGSFRLAFAQGIPLQWRSTPDGVVARQMRPISFTDEPTTDSMDVIVVQLADGSVSDTLMRFPSGGTFRGGSSPEIKLYSAEPVWALLNDLSLLYGVNDDYRLGLYSGGDLKRVITKPFEQRTVSERDQRAVMKAIEEAWKRAGVPPTALPRLRSIVSFGEFFPAFAGVQIGPEGSIWVQHVRSVSDMTDEELESFNLLEDAGAPDWDVFDAEGRYLGIVTMPDRFTPRVVVGERVYGVWRDELDVQYVMRMGIVWTTE